MPSITDEELLEFNRLKSLYKQSLIRESLDSIATLEQDIDEPIKRCVAALALLRCKPLWSCCGFDYESQPFHKTNMYGLAYVMLRDNRHTRHIANLLRKSTTLFKEQWQFRNHINDGEKVITIYARIKRDGWDDKDSIHFSELGATYIQYLEEFLMSLSGEFADEVVLTDTNGLYKKRFKSWQYPPKREWVIKKSDWVSEFPNGIG